MRLVELNPQKPDTAIIEEAASILEEGGLIIFPTETVYGLAVLVDNQPAVEKLYQLKNRSFDKPLTLHIHDRAAVEEIIDTIPPCAQELMGRYWPGPLTIVMLAGDGGKVGFRMPRNVIAREIIGATAGLIGATSANVSGAVPPLTVSDIPQRLLDDVDLVIDGGRTEYDGASTIVDVSNGTPVIVRQGPITI
ncbi:MAG: threonylcarbamoyl-AMP synthase [Candidatus Omnitrophica bacterium]|nr:threonylcarbamoyl-AMP synthase [Candidatus Omnitrophota bacterium]